MAQPPEYTRSTNFNDYSTSNPSSPHQGSSLDAEFNDIKTTTDTIRTNLELLQRDDGKLANLAVHAESLSNAVLTLIKATSNGYGVKGAWATDTAYAIGDLVDSSQATYLCFEAHTSGLTFGANSSKFILLANAAIQTTASAVDTLSGDGSTVEFTLTNNSPSGVTDVLVFVNGSLRTPTTDYTIPSDDKINFTTAPSSGTSNVIVWGTSTVVEAAKAAAQAARDTAETHRDDANEHKQTANLWANKVDGTVTDVDTGVDSSEFSSKAYAQSVDGDAPTGGSSKGWSQTAKNTQVPGAGASDRSAKHYSEVAADHKTDAETAKTAAESARDAAEGYTDSFDDRYLGAKASAPTEDNDGETLLDGALYYNTTSNVMYVYDTGTTNWIAISTQGLTLSNFAESEIVTESEGISSNDSDTKLPTTAAVKDYADTKIASSDLIDEDNMASDSATRPPSQQSVKAYVNSEDTLMGYQGEPHIIPGVLYPAVGGNDINGTDIDTSHGSTYTYGETHDGDGRKYYYTDIKGSKPIRDPRIGAHFGSQRHKFKSLQLLEQETATHEKNVYSVDGREWVRCVDGSNGWNARNDIQGTCVEVNFGNLDATDFIEITGYFNFANVSVFTNADHQNQTSIFLNGTDTSNDLNAATTVVTPLLNRYVDPGCLIDLNLGTINTPGINTIKLTVSDSSGSNRYALFYAIDLIAQDLSGTDSPNRSKIQIPSQDVVSYGKKFTVSGTPHYDPFNGFVDDTTLFSAKVDTATSLGLGTATTWGAPWDTGSDNHIRPFNGGRVVKWVDSDGTIKTSVTMMPRNAQNIGTTASNEITDVSSTNSHTINFSDDAVEHSLSEVAKTFHVKEFGSGSANGGTGGTYADASMLTTNDDDIAFVLDDGLTSLSGSAINDSADTIKPHSTDSKIYLTFIGTGLSITDGTQRTFAQNLPFGTHVYEMVRTGDKTISTHKIDGVQVTTGFYFFREITFYQPKKPPIPEDACVLADYMLLADYVKSATGGVNISKGIRLVSASRDMLHDTSSGSFGTCFTPNTNYQPFGVIGAFTTADQSAGVIKSKLPTFGTQFEIRQHNNLGDHFVDGSAVDHTNSSSHSGAYDTLTTQDDPLSLGLYTFESRNNASYHNITALGVVTPIHTSSHYQSFETPFLHELIGGDRNMEQTNLIVSPDGKTWDELTRDTSYIGKTSFIANTDNEQDTERETVIFDEFRGSKPGSGGTDNYFNMHKDFAIAYDRFICLKDGEYAVFVASTNDSSGSTGDTACIYVNGGLRARGSGTGSSYSNSSIYLPVFLKRGDYVQVKGKWYAGGSYSRFNITRL